MQIKKNIVIGLSGGVDSSVSLFLLKKTYNFNIAALFMRNWDSFLNNDIYGNKNYLQNICPQEKDYNDAQLVAKQLNIKLYRVDFIEEYWNYVFKNLIIKYKEGKTPNPDILCNKFIKFNYFIKYAINNINADKIAMGHYAQVRFNNQLNEYQLLKATDLYKDQTYFLSQLNQFQLSKTIFPIGHLTKLEVRKIAVQQNLITANKKNSTGICFIGKRKFKKFLENYIPNKIGNIIDIQTNNVIAQHTGAMYYTIGQRKGLNLGGMKYSYFVVGKNIKYNILYVASSLFKNKWLYSDSCTVININWINSLTELHFFCTAKFRYRQKEENVIVKIINNKKCLVIYKTKIKSVTPGQEAVFYNKNICLGGGVIDKVFLDNKKLWYM